MSGGRFDHVVVGAQSLEQGIAWARDRLGVDIPRGGRHVKMSTHNCVMRLDGEHYFEIIAIDPDADPVPHARWFGLDGDDVAGALARGPQLLTWAINVPDLQGGFARLRETYPLPAMNIEPMTRDDLRWQVAFARDGALIAGGLFPLVIEWAVARHPALNMQGLGCSLTSVALIDPEIEALRSALVTLELSLDPSLIELHAGDRTELQITLATPRGEVVLSNRGVLEGETDD